MNPQPLLQPVAFLEKFLGRVEKPGRYIGGEVNSIRKDPAGKTSVALFFPDVYEIGMSNQGCKILYELVNREPDFIAERVYSPWPDFEEFLKFNRLSLFSLENKQPINEFDVVGFSLQYELTFSNVINGLKLSNIPLLSSARDERHPLIVAGGPVSSNPEPMADFIDVFCVGEGEEALLEILREVHSQKRQGGSRSGLLRRLAARPGIYVPSLYSFTAGDRQTPILQPLNSEVPPFIRKRIHEDFADSTSPERPITPNISITHDRVVVELFRGCPHACRYCQAVKYYNKTRIRSPRRVLENIDRQLKATGYTEVSLSSLSTTDYPYLAELMRELTGSFPEVMVTLPSLRIDKSLAYFSEKINDIGDMKRQNLTLAPECGSDRLRSALRKGLTNAQLFEMVALALDRGVEVVKLYFMVGLPTEREEDIDAIIAMGGELAAIARKRGGRKRIKLSINPFVPKSHTAFQWDGMNSVAELNRKQDKIVQGLKRFRNLELTYRDPTVSYLESAFSRGGRELGRLLLKQVGEGFKFDGWYSFTEDNLQRWRQSAEGLGIDLDRIAYQPLPQENPLPWGHIHLSESTTMLWKERENAESTLS